MPNCELKYTHEEDVEATVSFLEMPATNPEKRPGEHYDYEACDACTLYLFGEIHPDDNRGRKIVITFRDQGGVTMSAVEEETKQQIRDFLELSPHYLQWYRMGGSKDEVASAIVKQCGWMNFPGMCGVAKEVLEKMHYDFYGTIIKVGDWVQDDNGLQGEVTELRKENVVRVLIEREGCDNRYPENREGEDLEIIERDDSFEEE